MSGSNFEEDIAPELFDACARCRKKLGVNYVTGNKSITYKDQDGVAQHKLGDKMMYCNESCAAAHGARVSDTFSF